MEGGKVLQQRQILILGQLFFAMKGKAELESISWTVLEVSCTVDKEKTTIW